MLVQLMQPIGNSLLGDIVPTYGRGRFFGLRNKIVGAASFVSALAAGFTLDYFSLKNPFIGFSILFIIAFIGRALSGVFKAMMINPEPDLAHEEKFSLFDFVTRMDKTNYGHFVSYITLFKFATSIAAPFFAVYLLKDLKFTYLQFTMTVAAEIVASFVAVGIWGNMIDRRGTKLVLYIGGVLTPLIPFFWLFSSNFYYLIFAEVISGVSWAAFNLSSSNFIFDAVKPENRVRCIAYHKFFESMAIFAGAAFGGILRLLVSLLMLPTMKEARLIELGIGHSFFKRYLTIRPSEGLVFEVIGKYHKHEEEKHYEKKQLKETTVKKPSKKDERIYTKRLLKFIDKSITPGKEQHDITDMHEIEHITEEIEKGKRK